MEEKDKKSYHLESNFGKYCEKTVLKSKKLLF